AGNTVNITNSTIGAQNQAIGPVGAGRGGGMFVAGIVNLVNSTVADNLADTGGGAYVDTGGTLNTQSATIAYNSAATLGGGVLNNGTVNAKSTAFVKGSGGLNGAGPDFSGALNSQGFNLIENASGCICAFTASDIRNVNSGFADLSNNGGPTATCLPGAPAIDHGVNAAGSMWDQRGSGFSRVIGPQADIGALELYAPDPVPGPIGGNPPPSP